MSAYITVPAGPGLARSFCRLLAEADASCVRLGAVRIDVVYSRRGRKDSPNRVLVRRQRVSSTRGDDPGGTVRGVRDADWRRWRRPAVLVFPGAAAG